MTLNMKFFVKERVDGVAGSVALHNLTQIIAAVDLERKDTSSVIRGSKVLSLQP